MNGFAIAALAVAGAGVGAASGALCVLLEGSEKLEEEEREERETYELDCAEAERTAAARGQAVPPAAPWRGDRYGWTWLELVLSPLLGAVGFTCFAAHEELGWDLVIHLLWVSVFVHVVVFDLKHRLILNRITYPAIAAALALAHFSPGLTVRNAAIGAVAIYLFFLLQSLLLGGSVLGMGDAKLGALVGATTGIGLDPDHWGAIYAVIAAVLLGGAAALLLLVTRVRGLKDPIPYGPFLCAGAALIIFHGPAGS